MMMVDRLIEQLRKRGLSVKAGAEPGTLELCGPNSEKTAELLETLKKFKPQLLERFAPLKSEIVPEASANGVEPWIDGESEPEPPDPEPE